MDALQELLNAIANRPEGAAPDAVVAEFLAEHAGQEGYELDALDAAAREAFEALKPEEGQSPSDSDLAAMESLAEVAKGVVAESQRVDGEAQARRDRADELARSLNPEGEEGENTEGENAGEGESDPAEGAPLEGEVVEEGTPESIAASAAANRARGQVDMAALRRRGEKKAQRPEDTRFAGISLVASADVPDFQPGQKLKGISGLTAAAASKLATFPTSPVEGLFLRGNIAKIETTFPTDLNAIGKGLGALDVVEHAADQKRLSSSKGSGSLVAAGGWCSPSETMYELAGELEDGDAGLINVPDIQVDRGGIRFTEGPDFRSLYSAIGFTQTEAQAIAGTEKPFYRVPCTNFVDVRADVIGLGIISGILNNDAYPELTERVVRGALAAHNHRYNQATIARMEAQSSPVTANVGPSAATSLLNTIELQIVDYRYGYRANESLLLEVVLPIWAKAMIRSDLALRSGVELVQVTNEQINAYFAARGARVQWVYDWQDSFANGTPNAGFGSTVFATAWPTTVKALIYAAGTFVRGRGNVITLDGIYDSTNIKTNDFVRLFTEEKILVVRRQYQSRVLTVGVAQNGATSAPVELDAQGRPVVA